MIRIAAALLAGSALTLTLAGCGGDTPPPREDGYAAGYSFMTRALAENPDPRPPTAVCQQMFYRLSARGDDRAADTLRGCTDALHADSERRYAPR